VELGDGVGGDFVARLFREERFLGGAAAFAAGVFAALACAGARRAGGLQLLVAGVAIAALAVVLRKRRVPVIRRVALLAIGAAVYLLARGYIGGVIH
jgi:hypothetical protein